MALMRSCGVSPEAVCSAVEPQRCGQTSACESVTKMLRWSVSQSIFYGIGGPTPHAGQHVAVGVQRLRYGSVT
jgi:hypothetical protein